MKQLLLCLLFFTFYYCASAQIRYTLTCNDSLSSVVKVSIQLTNEMKSTLNFIMPRSVPGAYNIVNYDDFIENLYAVNSRNEKLAMIKSANGAPRWHCTDTSETIIRIIYDVNISKMERTLAPSDASHLRSGFAGILNYSVFGWIDGTEKQSVHCTIISYDHWLIFTTNEPTTSLKKGSLTFKTDNYYTLADGQIYIGTKFIVKQFTGIVPLYIVSYCETGDEFLDDYGTQGTRSLKILKNYFGEVPFKDYSILLCKALSIGPKGVPSFGMEHLQSSTFFGDTSGFRAGAMSQQDVVRTMPTYLHHMGHAFIPLRCYGDSYRPYVKEIPPIISNIWFNEGFMWFLPYKELKLEAMKKRFNTYTYDADQEIKKMSLQDLSFHASLMYANDFRLGTAVYSRGALMALEMDNYLLEKSKGEKSMKDVLKFLYNWSKENNKPFTMREFPELINKATGIDLSEIYEKWQSPIQK